MSTGVMIGPGIAGERSARRAHPAQRGSSSRMIYRKTTRLF